MNEIEQYFIRKEMDIIIEVLENNEINPFISQEEIEKKGLGDVVEDVLTKFGITQERYKKWLNLEECDCTKRKEWLNNFFSWKVKK